MYEKPEKLPHLVKRLCKELHTRELRKIMKNITDRKVSENQVRKVLNDLAKPSGQS